MVAFRLKFKKISINFRTYSFSEKVWKKSQQSYKTTLNSQIQSKIKQNRRHLISAA